MGRGWLFVPWRLTGGRLTGCWLDAGRWRFTVEGNLSRGQLYIREWVSLNELLERSLIYLLVFRR